jgi:hypothetical protein
MYHLHDCLVSYSCVYVAALVRPRYQHLSEKYNFYFFFQQTEMTILIRFYQAVLFFMFVC